MLISNLFLIPSFVLLTKNKVTSSIITTALAVFFCKKYADKEQYAADQYSLNRIKNLKSFKTAFIKLYGKDYKNLMLDLPPNIHRPTPSDRISHLKKQDLL